MIDDFISLLQNSAKISTRINDLSRLSKGLKESIEKSKTENETSFFKQVLTENEKNISELKVERANLDKKISVYKKNQLIVE